jgi:hypothetical protein
MTCPYICIDFPYLWLVNCGSVEFHCQLIQPPCFFCQTVLCVEDRSEESCPLSGCDLSRVFGSRFRGRTPNHIYNMGSAVQQEREEVWPTPE